jgi:methyltransferase family protein
MVAESLKSLVPESLKKIVRCYRRSGEEQASYLRESTSYFDIGEPGPLITELFRKVQNIPGWFNVDDCGHFCLVLSFQSAMGVKGDLLEIGSYHGRSTTVMATCLQSGERIVVCDAFRPGELYDDIPSPERLMLNIERVNPGLRRDRIVIHECLSSELHLSADEKFRFIHVDGGHSAEEAYADLELCSKHVLPNGIIVMDDYHHKDYPGVAQGTDRFLAETDAFVVLADLNRHGALGRKLYLLNTGT